MIIRAIFVLIQIVLLYLMQTSVFTSFALAGVVPDLLMILVIAVAFTRGRLPAMFTGLLCGLMIDCTYSDFIGLFALMYAVIGYAAGYSHKIYDEDDYTLPLVLTGAAELVYNVLYYIFFFLLKGKLNIGFYMVNFMFPRMIYTVLISIILYKLFNWFNVFMKRFDKE